MRNRKQHHLTFFIFILLNTFLMAQSSLQVVTKVIEKNVPFKFNQTLKINGIKSKIEIAGWDKEEIKIKLSLVSKNIDKAVAEKDLAHIKYSVNNVSGGYALSNSYETTKINSTLSITYELMVPNKCLLDLKNSYGNVIIKDISGKLTLDAEYGNVNLTSINGIIIINSYFNDIIAENINSGNFKSISNHSTLNFSKISGVFDIETTYGDLLINSVMDLKNLNVKSSKSDVNISFHALEKYNFNLSAYYGEIILPNDNKFHLTENTEAQKKYILSSPKISNLITISNVYGNIGIK